MKEKENDNNERKTEREQGRGGNGRLEEVGKEKIRKKEGEP